ncbi:MAG TPA: response regulator transcription factor [Micromonosporaceae bacterium]|jgi:DNA-binding NarL/FixJ family response regulator
MIRCLIVDDSPHFLRAARRLLERQGVAVVGVATTIAEALERAAKLRPDVTLVDIDLRGESGLDLTRRMREATPGGSQVILVSTHDEADFADLIVTSSAIGFLSKSALSAGAIGSLLGRAASGGDGGDPLTERRGR